jgi:hypothetical protein
VRPNLAQIIEKVEKYNNIGEDFTVESESNLKSHVAMEREHDRMVFERPVKYQELSIREDLLDKTKKREPVASNVFTQGGHSMQEQSLCIKEPSPALNHHNFDGRVFASTPHHSQYQQTLFTSHHQYVPAAHYYQSMPNYPPANQMSPPPSVTVNPPSNAPAHFATPNHTKVTSGFAPGLNTVPPTAHTTEKYLGASLQHNYNLY